MMVFIFNQENFIQLLEKVVVIGVTSSSKSFEKKEVCLGKGFNEMYFKKMVNKVYNLNLKDSPFLRINCFLILLDQNSCNH